MLCIQFIQNNTNAVLKVSLSFSFFSFHFNLYHILNFSQQQPVTEIRKLLSKLVHLLHSSPVGMVTYKPSVIGCQSSITCEKYRFKNKIGWNSLQPKTIYKTHMDNGMQMSLINTQLGKGNSKLPYSWNNWMYLNLRNTWALISQSLTS